MNTDEASFKNVPAITSLVNKFHPMIFVPSFYPFDL